MRIFLYFPFFFLGGGALKVWFLTMNLFCQVSLDFEG